MSMTRSLAELQKEVDDLVSTGDIPAYVLPKAKNGKAKPSKKFFIDLLQDYTIRKRYGSLEQAPQHLQLMLAFQSPMLADRMQAKKDDVQKAIHTSEEWGFQEKMDGVRLVRVWVKGEGFHYYSRNLSVKDFLPVEYKNIFVPHEFDEQVLNSIDSFILDSELVCENPNISTIMGNRGVVTETQLQAVAALIALNDVESLHIQETENAKLKFFDFDCFYFNGEWLVENGLVNDSRPNRPLMQVQREKVSKHLSNLMSSAGFLCEHLETVYGTEQKASFLQSIFESKGEGVIAKHKHALYRPVDARSKNLWVKIKRSMSESLTSTGYNDTVDAYVSGFGEGEKGKGYEGMVGFIRFSVNLVNEKGERVEHEIASVATIPMEMRKRITIQGPDGSVQMDPRLMGKCAEIDGVNVSARARRIRHAKIVRWRDDKLPTDCELSEDFLNQMIF